ncbi:MAG: hypothetical protein RI973_875 [Bacteroidota bacterium]
MLALLTLSLQGCLKDQCERTVTYTYVEPVYKTIEEIRAGQVTVEAPRELVNPGKIYYYDNKIFINESREGVHVIDNSNPSNPVNVQFISIPGNEDIAIKNGLLYANSYIDLWTVDLENYQLVGRTENVFPPLWDDLLNNSVVVYYQETKKTEVMDCEQYGSLFHTQDGSLVKFSSDFSREDAFNAINSSTSNPSSSSSSGTGVGGSMARFTIVSDYLYVVDQFSMRVFDLGQPTAPVQANVVNIGWGIETIFPYEDKLFIGSNSGMFIYDNSNPLQPFQLAAFAHARACDPVFVKDNHAWVTLRSGNICEGFINQLDLIDITNITNPVLLRTFPMDNPHGLSIKGDNLFLCEGEFGLKSFDISDPLEVSNHLLDHEKDIHSFDVISLPGDKNLLVVIGQDGFYQYDFDNPADLKLVSKIQVGK